MSKARRSIGLNLLLLGLSAVLTLLAVEGLMRIVLKPSALVGNHPGIPALNQWKNELRYWERNRDKPPEALNRHDPQLGWDSSYGASRVRGMAEVPDTTRRRAVAVGDSFVFGNEVAADENFSALLDQADNGLQVLNLGVPGYGIDQSYLKYLAHGAAYQPDIILFGIYLSDYERSTVSFSAFAKPLFRFGEDNIVTTGQPVPAPLAELARIASALEGRWYLAEFIRNLSFRLQRRRHEQAFLETGDRIVGHILGAMQVHSAGQRLLILNIPRGESFTEHDDLEQEVQRRLLRIYRQLGLEFIDLTEAFLARSSADQVAEHYYVVHDSGSVGHLNPDGHRLLASLIANRLNLPAP